MLGNRDVFVPKVGGTPARQSARARNSVHVSYPCLCELTCLIFCLAAPLIKSCVMCQLPSLGYCSRIEQVSCYRRESCLPAVALNAGAGCMKRPHFSRLDSAIDRARIGLSLVTLLSIYIDPTTGGLFGIAPS